MSSILVDIYIGLYSLFQVKMSRALGDNLTYDVEGEIHFIATSFSLAAYLHEEYVIIWLVFERIDWNSNYVYDIELGYVFPY